MVGKVILSIIILVVFFEIVFGCALFFIKSNSKYFNFFYRGVLALQFILFILLVCGIIWG